MAVIGGVAVGVVLLLVLAGIGFFIHRRLVTPPPGLRQGQDWAQKGREAHGGCSSWEDGLSFRDHSVSPPSGVLLVNGVSTLPLDTGQGR